MSSSGAAPAPGVLDAILTAGVDVVRLNFSHGDPSAQVARAQALREAAHRAGREVGILVDLPGPKIRIGALPAPVDLSQHETVVLGLVYGYVPFLILPLFAALVVVETSDIMFAIDSVPAILAISRDPFIVFTSNAFAILGLRSLYFLLAGLIHRFAYLKYGLAALLAFAGGKMLLSDVVHLEIWVSLGIIVAILGGAIAVSLIATRREADRATVVVANVDERQRR